jgi:RNA polymerase sigma-70 factor (ECF subfamily)
MADADQAARAVASERQRSPRRVAQLTDADAADCAEPSDATLALAARHDARAIARLYERYADPLYRYALARSASAAVADDVVSETFVAVLETLERFDPLRGSFAAWLFTIAGRRLADHARRERRFWRAISRRWAPLALAEDDTLETLVRREDAARLRAALAQLPDDERELLLLRYAAGLTSAQIGELRGLSPGATRMRLGRQRERLALDLGDDP